MNAHRSKTIHRSLPWDLGVTTQSTTRTFARKCEVKTPGSQSHPTVPAVLICSPFCHGLHGRYDRYDRDGLQGRASKISKASSKWGQITKGIAVPRFVAPEHPKTIGSQLWRWHKVQNVALPTGRGAISISIHVSSHGTKSCILFVKNCINMILQYDDESHAATCSNTTNVDWSGYHSTTLRWWSDDKSISTAEAWWDCLWIFKRILCCATFIIF